MTIMELLYERNLKTAWAMAGEWEPDDQERLAELIVAQFIRRPLQEAES